MRFIRKRALFAGLFLAAGLSLATIPSARAQLDPTDYTLIDGLHTDLAFPYADGAWDLHVHAEGLGELAPDKALLYANQNTKNTRPAGSQWDFTGTSAGADLWVLPQDPDPFLNPAPLFLGIAGENAAGVFVPNALTISLVAFSGPGQFSLWRGDLSSITGSPLMSTLNGVNPDEDRLSILATGHSHFNFGFTQQGIYELTLRASGTLASGQTVTSPETTFYFGIQQTPTPPPGEVIPEPGTLALLAPAALGLLALRRRGSPTRI